MTPDRQIKGNIALTRNALLGGNLQAKGNALIQGQLRVEGWLDAPNLKTPCKGLFLTPESLAKAYPRPKPGWWALVGDALPAEIYCVTPEGWTPTGESGGDITVDLDYYDSQIDSVKDDIAALETSIADISEIEHPIAVKDISNADLVIADQNENPILTVSGGHIRTANFDSSNIQVSESSSTSNDNLASAVAADKLILNGDWRAYGTSITSWEVEDGGHQAYPYWIRQRITFRGYQNHGWNGHSMAQLAADLSQIQAADYYTIEHGINDWGQGTPLGTIDDFINDTGAGTFYGAYRKVIDAMYTRRASAQIILCTPTKAHNYGNYLPDHWWDPKNGKYLKDYVNAVREIGEFLSLPVADFFAESQLNQINLTRYTSGDGVNGDANLHPNTKGHKMMAKVLYQKMLLWTEPLY